MADPRSDAVVLFGATGDLARKKLFPALFHLVEREELGLSGILAELNCGGQIPHQQVMHSLTLLCTEVMPQFK